MGETVRWIRERRRGATKGGERMHLERNGNWIPVKKVATEKKSFSGDMVAWAVLAPDTADWYSIDFSSNSNNRNFSIGRYRHQDFPSQLPENATLSDFPNKREFFNPEEFDLDEILAKTSQTSTFKERKKRIEELRPEIETLLQAVKDEFKNLPPGVKQVLERPKRYYVSAAMLGAGGTRSLGNIKKQFQQAYEIEAIRKVRDVEVQNGDLSRSWQTRGLPPGTEDLEIPRDVRKQLGIGFGEPNFILDGEVTYSIWLEFPFTKYTRPDLFVVEGDHESPFQPSVRGFLNDYDQSFYDDVLAEWESGYVEGLVLGDYQGRSSGGTSQQDIKQFTTGLSEHLKSGVVIESKEEASEQDDAKEQYKAYREIFSEQEVLLVTWFRWKGRNPSTFEIFDRFDTSIEEAEKLADTVDRLI